MGTVVIFRFVETNSCHVRTSLKCQEGEKKRGDGLFNKEQSIAKSCVNMHRVLYVKQVARRVETEASGHKDLIKASSRNKKKKFPLKMCVYSEKPSERGKSFQ